MVGGKDPDEIELGDALYLVKSNKSIFVWIGGRTNAPLYELLEIDKDKVIDVNPYLIIDKDSYPKELLNYERPIFVCHHGIASYELVKELANNDIKGYSLAGGIEGIKGRA
jgi:rhodanese-related sulfurtransferase